MGRLLKFFGIVMALLLTSCQFSEDIYFNEDGSGTISYVVDGSELMQLGSNMGAGAENKGLGQVMDSTIIFKELFEEKKDSIFKLSGLEQKRLKAMENFKMHINMNPETQSMVFELSTEFKQINEVQDMFQALNTMSSLNKKMGEDANDNSNASPLEVMKASSTAEVNYVFEGNTFKRNAKIVDTEKHQKAMDSLGDVAMMFGASRYKVNYHFPRAVKSVSNEGALFSDDRSTVSFDVSFMSVIREPNVLDVEVILEDK